MFLVTDVTGHVGKAVVAELANLSVAVRALTSELADAACFAAERGSHALQFRR